MTGQVKEEQEIEVFIGARDLKDEVKNIMPTYDLMLKQIEQIRDTSRASAGSRHNRYNKSINNTIGIFGARGMGKSSVMFTLINHLNPPQPVQCDRPLISPNLVLDIIEPDHFGDNTKIMGSIVGLLNKTVEEQLRTIKHHVLNNPKSTEFEDYFTKGVLRPNNALKSAMNALIEYHLYTENEYRKILVHNYDDLATHIRKSEKLLTPDIEFKARLDKLISLLVYNQRKLLEKPYIDQEPLIFLFIDDIDLKMTRSRELMESILQYANHPNIITVLSGDYTILQEAITLALIQDENLRHSNISVDFQVEEMPLHERKLKLAHEYLKKIIPPARRHNLLEWNNNTIPQFAFGKWTLISQLARLFGDNSVFSYANDQDEEPRLVPLSQSYSIFDRTPRGIVNVYYHIHEILGRYRNLFSHEERSAEERKEKFNLVKSLVDTIILSSTKLTEQQRHIIGKYVQWGQDAQNTYLDYSILDAITTHITSSNEQKEESVLLSLIIVGEIILALLNDVRCNDAQIQNQMRVKAIKEILQLDQDVRPNKYGHIVMSLLDHIKFDNSLYFAHLLLGQKGWLTDSLTNSYVAEQHDRWMLKHINQLTKAGREENLLSWLYQEQYYCAKNKLKFEYDHVLNFISDTSVTNEDHIYYQTLYGYPSEEASWGNITIWDINTIYALDVFINTIVEIQRWDEDQFLEVMKQLAIHHPQDNQPVSLKLAKVIRSLMKSQQADPSKELTTAQITTINKWVTAYYMELFDTIRLRIREGRYQIEWLDKRTVETALEAFKTGFSGLTETTIYAKTQAAVRNVNINDIDFTSYQELLSKVGGLSSNSYVWYGRLEARRLLQVLKEQSYVAVSSFDQHEFWVLRHLRYYLEQVNHSKLPKKDHQSEQIKKEMQQKLEDGFRQAMNTVSADLNDLGLDLDEDEEPTGDA